MAHEVIFDIPQRRLQREDVIFKVKSNGVKFGELRVSKGSVVWFPKNRSYGYKMGWKRFDDLMSEFAIKTEKKR